jgi:vancomycin resistance protein YoaR
VARRRAEDAVARRRFARVRGDPDRFPWLIGRAELPVADYPGQAEWVTGKRNNLALACDALDRTVLRPLELLSFWDRLGRPTERAGYAEAAALRGGVLVGEIGGSTCLVSTVLYEAGLRAGLVPHERHNHSVDTYGPSRYYGFGLDATVEYAYLDLRFASPYSHPVLLRAAAGERVTIEFWASAAPTEEVDLVVSPPTESSAADGSATIVVETTGRRRRPGGVVTDEPLGRSAYRLGSPPQSSDR